MAVLNFAPLLIWALGIIWLIEWREKWMAQHFNLNYEDYQKRVEKNSEGIAKLWLWGCFIFLWLGLLLTYEQS